MIDGLVVVVGAALAGKPVMAADLIPEKYRPPKPPEPVIDDEANRRAAVTFLDALGGGLRV